MILAHPVTFTPPTITRANGEVRVQKPITLSELDVTIMDNSKRQSVVARIGPCPFPVVLWEKASYVAAGDYTQASVEARVLELLGSDLSSGLIKLFSPPVHVKPVVA